MMPIGNVCAVVVTFFPDEEAFCALLERLTAQVSHVFVVDNTPDDSMGVVAKISCLSFSNITLISMGRNFGIAKALNTGITAALRSGAEYIVLSDQDSLPAPCMVKELLVTIQQYGDAKIGAVGPTFTDVHTGITFPFQTQFPSKFFYGHGRASEESPNIEALTLITSGMLVPAETFEDVGLMREDFFIDQVDMEWCHRARHQGWMLLGTSRASMFHRMGDQRMDVWYFGWRRETAYPPLRLYYRIRNFIALCKMREVPFRWKLRNAWYSLGVVYSHVVFGKNRVQSLAKVSRGVFDGVCGRMGIYAD